MSDETVTSAPTSVGELSVKMELKGIVKRIELYGAFIDVGVGVDGLLHISQLGRANVRNVEDVLKLGEEITVYVVKIDPIAGRIQLSLVRPPDFSWDDLEEGQMVSGKVVRVEGYGAFIDIGAERPGMIHVSEMSDDYVSSPTDVVKVGDTVQARIIGINRKKRQIDMSLKTAAIEKVKPEEDQVDEDVPTAMELALRMAMEGKQSPRERRENRERTRREQLMREREDIIARTLRGHSH